MAIVVTLSFNHLKIIKKIRCVIIMELDPAPLLLFSAYTKSSTMLFSFCLSKTSLYHICNKLIYKSNHRWSEYIHYSSTFEREPGTRKCNRSKMSAGNMWTCRLSNHVRHTTSDVITPANWLLTKSVNWWQWWHSLIIKKKVFINTFITNRIR